MTYTDKNLIYERVRNVPAIYWRVSSKEGDKQFLDEQNDLMEPDESALLLQNTLESLSGTAFVQISTRDAKAIKDSMDFQTGIWKYNVKCIRVPDYNKPNVGTGGVTLTQFLDVYNQLHSANMEVFRLKMKIDSLESEKGSALDSIIGPIAASFEKNPQGTIAAIGSIFKPKPQISKPVEDFTNWTDANKITSALERLKAQDAEYIETLNMLATAAEKNPELLPYFKTAIKEHL